MPAGTEPITLFLGGDDGYADARAVGRNSYAWALNMDCRGAGKAALAITPTLLASAKLAPALAVLEWEDANGIPILLVASGIVNTSGRVQKITDNALSTDDTDAGTRFTDAVLFRHDGSDQDAEMAFFCRGGAAGDDVLRGRTKAGAYSENDAKADHLAVVGGDLWRSKGYRVSKLTLDTDPDTEASWATITTPVGRPTYEVNKILDLGGSPLILKGDGIFKYNTASSANRFENQTPFIHRDKDNGKAGFMDGRGRVYYDTDEDFLVFTFGALSQQGPGLPRFNTIDRNTPWGRISALTADSHHVYAALEPGTVRTQQLGLTVKKDLNGSFTDYTTQTTDRKYSTEADFTDVDTPASDFIVVGADEPFWGVHFQLSSVTTNADVVSLNVQYSTGAGTWSAVTGTAASDSTARLFQDGLVAFSREPLEDADVFATGLWVKAAVDGDTKYWLRYTISNGTLAGVKAWDISIVPYRPAIDPDLFGHNTARAQAGTMPKILTGTWVGQRLVWQDTWTVDSPKIESMIVARATATNTTSHRTLWLITAGSVLYIPVGGDMHPARATWPLTHGATVPHALMCSYHDFFLPGNIKSVKKLVIRGQWLQADDEFWFYYRWDNAPQWEKVGPFDSGFPVVIPSLEGKGLVLHTAFQLKDTTRDAVAPQVEYIGIAAGEWEDLGPAEEGLEQDIESPQLI
ncbi:hypothetical protein LCGC14_0445010 [marine sediment metagenome]|uniref:Uncharacterized protein n=1 Tax=marine sediment metagenome TaxID=412755 RepID=A0A0F9SQ36_9ZZZZ